MNDTTDMAGNPTAHAEVEVVNQYGMHARPATRFVQVAGGFEAEVEVSKNGGESVNGRSVMGLLTLAAEKGSKLRIRAEGADAGALVHRLVELVSSGFEMEEA